RVERHSRPCKGPHCFPKRSHERCNNCSDPDIAKRFRLLDPMCHPQSLNATLTSPSRMAALSQIAKGNLPAVLSWDVCARTYGGLGADSSRTISHWGGPPSWVIATDQPAGSFPGTPRSKRTTCAEAVKDRSVRMA